MISRDTRPKKNNKTTHKLAVTSAGDMYGWGANDVGQLGIGVSGADRWTPTIISSAFSLRVNRLIGGPTAESSMAIGECEKKNVLPEKKTDRIS